MIVAAAYEMARPAWLHAMWLAPAVLVLVAWSTARTRGLLRRFASAQMLTSLGGTASRPRVWVKAWLLGAALLLTAVALAGPRNDPREVEVPSMGRDIVFVVDVSRSMLARDLAPNRLEKAKLWINDLVDELEGDRVALVAFAGAPVVRCPLTLDRSFFRLTLGELTPDSAPLGGTAIGDAIRKATGAVFGIDGEKTDRGLVEPARDIILITDGEDQDSFPVEAASAAGLAGVRLIVIGIGSEHDGAVVPTSADDRSPVRYQGQPVRSRLDAGMLAKIAGTTPGGVFLKVGTGTIDLAQIDRDLMRGAAQRQTGQNTVVRYTERFAWFLAAALALLVIESLVAARAKEAR